MGTGGFTAPKCRSDGKPTSHADAAADSVNESHIALRPGTARVCLGAGDREIPHNTYGNHQLEKEADMVGFAETALEERHTGPKWETQKGKGERVSLL